jgi:hypothetical protein
MQITTVDGANVTRRKGSRLGEGLSPAKKSAVITKINFLERQLFDDKLARRRGISEDRATELLAEINALRGKLGWLSLDRLSPEAPVDRKGSGQCPFRASPSSATSVATRFCASARTASLGPPSAYFHA